VLSGNPIYYVQVGQCVRIGSAAAARGSDSRVSRENLGQIRLQDEATIVERSG